MANNRGKTDWFRAFPKNQNKENRMDFRNLLCQSPASQSVLKTYWHTDEKLQQLHDEFIENAVSNFYLPMAVAPNFVINEIPYVLLWSEESSVVAASANAAKFWSTRGGFHAEIIGTENRSGTLSVFGTSPKTR